MTPSEVLQDLTPPSPARKRSSVAAGTPFKALGYLKNRDPPIAMEDHEYPDWLWSLLDKSEKAKKGAAGSDADVYGMRCLCAGRKGDS